MKVKIMKKTMAAVLAVLILTGGCSLLNPFVKESTETEARFEPNKFLWLAAKNIGFIGCIAFFNLAFRRICCMIKKYALF